MFPTEILRETRLESPMRKHKVCEEITARQNPGQSPKSEVKRAGIDSPASGSEAESCGTLCWLKSGVMVLLRSNYGSLRD